MKVKIDKLLLWFAAFFLIAGCTAPATTPAAPSPLRLISIHDLELLRPGSATATQLKSKFGAPNRTLPLKGKDRAFDIWAYELTDNSGASREANFVIERQSGLLFSSSWVPAASDPLAHLDSALQYFNASKFTAKDVGWIANHEYSGDAVYSDTSTGISMYVRKAHRDIVSISFERPQPDPLAERRKP